ncbi:hypothetical protein JYT57_00765 [Nitrosarchaeum koreense]|nr:hypothetical protein [Nitrosarchaeum koreense]
MKPIVIIAIAFVLLIPATAYGTTDGYFEVINGKRFSQSPTVCLIQPNDPLVNEQKWRNWYLDMKPAMDTWRAMLQSSGSGNWEITTVNVPVDKLDLLNSSECDIKVNFVKTPNPKYADVNYFGIALTWYGVIEIVYMDSLNPMKTMMIIGTEKYEGLIKVTQIAKYGDVWVAKDGRAFEINEYGSTKLINQTIKDREDTRINLDRYNSEFTSYKETQIDKAIKLLLEKCPECLDSFVDFDDSFSYAYPEKINKLDNSEIIQKMILENERAQKIMNHLLDPILYLK